MIEHSGKKSLNMGRLISSNSLPLAVIQKLGTYNCVTAAVELIVIYYYKHIVFFAVLICKYWNYLFFILILISISFYLELLIFLKLFNKLNFDCKVSQALNNSFLITTFIKSLIKIFDFES